MADEPIEFPAAYIRDETPTRLFRPDCTHFQGHLVQTCISPAGELLIEWRGQKYAVSLQALVFNCLRKVNEVEYGGQTVTDAGVEVLPDEPGALGPDQPAPDGSGGSGRTADPEPGRDPGGDAGDRP